MKGREKTLLGDRADSGEYENILRGNPNEWLLQDRNLCENGNMEAMAVGMPLIE